MQLYNNFIGIDIGKFNFVVGVHGQKETKEYNNTMQEIKEFSKDYKNILGYSLCIKKNTGGYELEILYTLCGLNIAVHIELMRARSKTLLDHTVIVLKLINLMQKHWQTWG